MINLFYRILTTVSSLRTRISEELYYFMRSCCPLKSKEFQNQNEISQITDEEFETLKAPPQFSVQQKTYQFFCFILFLGFIRLLLTIIFLLFTISIILIYKFALKAFQFPRKAGKRFCLSVARFGIRCILFCFGIFHINTEGQFDEGARFIIANHTSILDAFAILIFHDYAAVVEDSVRQIPLIPTLLESVSAIYVDYKKQRRASKMIVDFVDDFGNSPVLIFPEGAPNGHGSALMKFEKTAFTTPYKVQPITLRYYMLGVPQGYNTYVYQGENIFGYIFRLLAMPPTVLSVHFLPVMSMENDAKSEVKAFSRNAQLAMANFIGIRAVDKSLSTSRTDKSE